MWTSSNTQVASVTSDGQVRALKQGTATIVALVGGKSAYVTVTVAASGSVVLESVSIAGKGVSGGTLSIPVDSTVQLAAVAYPAGASLGTPSWMSSHSDIVRVDGTGKLTALKQGSAAVVVLASGKTASLIVTVAKAQNAGSFADVPQSNLFFNDIEWMAATGLAKGDGGKFNPSQELTRAQMATFLYRLSVARGNAATAGFTPSAADYRKFSDVDQSHWAAKEILWAASIGITSGDGHGRYSPDEPCTRAQMASFMRRFAIRHGDAAAADYSPSAADYAKFKDVDRSHWAATDVLWAAAVGITSGDGRGGFSPETALVREQMAAFMHRLDGHLKQ